MSNISNCCMSYNNLTPCSIRTESGEWLLVWKCDACKMYYTAEFNTTAGMQVLITDIVPVDSTILGTYVDIIDHDKIDKFQLKNIIAGIDLFFDERNTKLRSDININNIELGCGNCLYDPVDDDDECILTCRYCGTGYRYTKLDTALYTNIRITLVSRMPTESTLSADTDEDEYMEHTETQMDLVEHEDTVVADTDTDIVETTMVSDDHVDLTDDDAEDEVELSHMYGLHVEHDSLVEDTTDAAEPTEVIESTTIIDDIPSEVKKSMDELNASFQPVVENDNISTVKVASGNPVYIKVTHESCDNMLLGECMGDVGIFNTRVYKLRVDTINVKYVPSVKVSMGTTNGKFSTIIEIDPSIVDRRDADKDCVLDTNLLDSTMSKLSTATDKHIIPMFRVHFTNSDSDLPDKLKSGYIFIEADPLINFDIDYNPRST